MKYLGKIQDNKDLVTKEYADNRRIPYLTCATASGTAAKTTTLVTGSFTSDDLVSGAQVLVKFTNANGVASPTLSVNGTTAKSIKRYGTTAPSTSAGTSWNAGSVVLFTYDGTYWQQVGYLNTTYSEISVANITNGSGSSTGTITGRRAKAAVEAFAPVTSVNGNTGAVSLTASDVGALADSTTYVSTVNGNSGAVTVPTYSSKTAASGGTDVSLCTTGEKYTWNNKQNALTNPVTGTGTSGYLAKFNAASGITNGPQLGSDTTTFLRNDGTWATPTSTPALIGTTLDYTPMDVADALFAGQTVSIDHTDQTYGVITANSFNISDTFDVIVASVIAEYNSAYYLFDLVGNLSGDTWSLDVVGLAKLSDIPTTTSELSNDSNFVSGTGDSGYIPKFNGSHSITDLVEIDASGTRYLKENGQWDTPTLVYPTGTIQMYGGSTAPSGWLICNGDAVSRTTYSALFDVIGTTYGTGNGSTTFNLPDLRGRTPIGSGTGTATNATAHSLGSKGGNEDAIIPYHRHKAYKYTSSKVASGTVAARIYDPNGSNGDSTMYTDYQGTSGNATGANMMPYTTINFIIYTGR